METKNVILELRTKKGLSQDELAEKVMVTRQAVSRWENGETAPNTETLKLLSKEFNVTINTLLGAPRQLICQCCGMPLEDEIVSHDRDGSLNENYCKWCYADGTYTYTIIGINQDKPSDSNGNALNKSQYGDVLTVMPLGAPAGAGNGSAVTIDASKTPWGTDTAPMNSSNMNNGSWKSSTMRSSIMASYLAKLPANTQKAIGYIQKVTGQCCSNTNITTGDKCFLLSGKEIFGGTGNENGSYCTTAEASATFQYQYFANIATSTDSRTITGAPGNQ